MENAKDGSGDPATNKQVLVVDDSEMLRTSVCKVVRDLGFAAVEAENGVEALEKIAAELPDLVMLDLMMPQMGGIEVLRKLREHEQTRTIPVIVVTASADLDSVQRTWGLQVIDYVRKPIRVAELRQRLGKYLGGQVAGPSS